MVEKKFHELEEKLSDENPTADALLFRRM